MNRSARGNNVLAHLSNILENALYKWQLLLLLLLLALGLVCVCMSIRNVCCIVCVICVVYVICVTVTRRRSISATQLSVL